MIQVHGGELLLDAESPFGFRHATQSKCDILRDGQVRKQRVILKKQTNAPLASRHVDPVRGIEQHAPMQHDAAPVRLIQSGDGAERHRLARAGRAEQAQRRTVCRELDVKPETRFLFFDRDFERHDSFPGRLPFGRAIRHIVIGGLHLIVDIDGDSSRHAGDISTDHQHDAEFANRVRKTQHGSGDRAGRGERQDHAKKCSQPRCAQRPRRLDQFAVHCFKPGGKRLHRERQAVEHGSDQEASEGERQRVAEP